MTINLIKHLTDATLEIFSNIESINDRVSKLEVSLAELKSIIDTDKLEKAPKIAVPFQKIIDLYHKILPSFRKVEKLTTVRKTKIRSRWKEDLPDLEHWENYFKDIANSKFLTGPDFRQNDIDWVINAANFTKIMEGKYHDVRKQVR